MKMIPSLSCTFFFLASLHVKFCPLVCVCVEWDCIFEVRVLLRGVWENFIMAKNLPTFLSLDILFLYTGHVAFTEIVPRKCLLVPHSLHIHMSIYSMHMYTICICQWKWCIIYELKNKQTFKLIEASVEVINNTGSLKSMSIIKAL